MPVETIIVIACVGTAFAFFAGMLAYGDLTWRK
jgi:hypothetical protein